MKKTIADLSKTLDLTGKHVLVRVDFNVPLSKSGEITDDTRITAALPTIQFLRERGAKLVLCSHLGQPKGIDESLKLDPVAARLSALLGINVNKLGDCVGDEVTAAAKALGNGEVMLLENLRFHSKETKNGAEFAQALAQSTLAEVYVNDAFGAAHRAHASTEGVAKFIQHRVAGFLMEKELRYLYGAVDSPARPLAAIVGGAKVSSKIAVLESLLNKVDTLVIGGGMAFTFLRAQGLSVGKSLVEEDKIGVAEGVLNAARARGVPILLPTDVVIATEFAANAPSSVVSVDRIPSDAMGLDIGPASIAAFSAALAPCRTVVWNGPMGVFEFPAFAHGTTAVARVLAELSDSGAVTIVGGGDSVAAVGQAGVSQRISHISTGGGASLELLEGKALPGVEALDNATGAANAL